MALMPLLHASRMDIPFKILLGDFTGLIGDPSGTGTERPEADPHAVQQNTARLDSQIRRILGAFEAHNNRGPADYEVLRNSDWLGSLTLGDFLRVVGRNARVATMLSRDSVRSRIESQGISYGEFSYQLLQSYDFYHLHKTRSVNVQVGGSDQWGNILGGIDLISKTHPGHNVQLSALTVPLLTNASGEKIGKSAGNGVLLDSDPYEIFHFLINVSDSQVESYILRFTFASEEEVAEVMADHAKEPEAKLAQRFLARELISWLYGREELKRAELASKILFGGSLSNTSAQEIVAAFNGTDRYLRTSLETSKSLVDVCLNSRIVSSKGLFKKRAEMGGIYLNGRQVTDPRRQISDADMIDGRIFVVRIGKKDNYIFDCA